MMRTSTNCEKIERSLKIKIAEIGFEKIKVEFHQVKPEYDQSKKTICLLRQETKEEFEFLRTE